MYLSSVTSCFGMCATPFANIVGKNRIASQKSFFVRCKYLVSSDSVLASFPRLHLRSSTLEQERNMAYVTEKEEDVS